MYTVMSIAVVNIEHLWTRSQNGSNLCRPGDVVTVPAGNAGNSFRDNVLLKVVAPVVGFLPTTSPIAATPMAGRIAGSSSNGVVSIFGGWTTTNLVLLLLLALDVVGVLLVMVVVRWRRGRHGIIVVMSASRLLGVGRMRMGHWYRGSHGKWAVLLASLVQRVVQRKLAAQDELERPGNLGVDGRWDRNQRRRARFILSIFQVTVEGKSG